MLLSVASEIVGSRHEYRNGTTHARIGPIFALVRKVAVASGSFSRLRNVEIPLYRIGIVEYYFGTTTVTSYHSLFASERIQWRAINGL